MPRRLLAALLLAPVPCSFAFAESGGSRLELRGSEWSECACEACRAIGAGSAEAAPETRFEAGTGRDLRNYAPDRPADLLHMKLQFDIPDMNDPRLSAKQTLSFAPIARPLETLPLNAEQMTIDSVSIPDDSPGASATKVSYSYDDHKLVLRFDPALPPERQASVVITYRLNRPPEGLVWTPESPAWPGRPAQLHTQGQPETNRFWFPAHDSPNERLTTEIIATVPAGFSVISNGREAEKPVTRAGRSTYHWLQDKDHVSYLVSMIVGKFDTVDVAPEGSRLSMPVSVPPGKGGLVKDSYGRTPAIVKAFEQRLDEPYPWDRYAQTLVWNFGAGGMENTSATTMFDTAILEEKALLDGDLDGLISHELAHQWFGDLITCNTWAHIWLNEGWATYCTGLWYEARDGYDPGYLEYMHRTMRNLARNDQFAPGDKPTRPGMVSTVYKGPWETFRRVSNPYPKGASILHMLRKKLGDELFFKCVAEYIDRYKHRTPETADFRRTFEEVSGMSLERFFEQWAVRPGTPKLIIRADWDEKKMQLTVRIRQQQLIDADRPAFAFDLPIEVVPPNRAEPQKFVVAVDGALHEQTFTLDAEPAMVLVDPELTVLMSPELDLPRRMLVNQLTTTRSIAARLDAAYQLRSRPTDDGAAALARCLCDSSEHYSVRAMAADSLGAMRKDALLLGCLGSGIPEARARVAALRALGEAGGPDAIAVLAKHAGDVNESFACRGAALRALGKLGGPDQLSVIVEALGSDSQHDQVRVAALTALADLNLKDGLEPALRCTAPGNYPRTRPEACETVGKLGKFDKDRAFKELEALAFDSEERTARAACAALVELKDRRGLAVLDKVIATSRTDENRDRAQQWRSDLAAKLADNDSIDSAEGEIDKLKGEVKRLQTLIEKRPQQREPVKE